MTRAEVKTFIETGVQAINPALSFGTGRITEWNSNRSNEYPGTWLETIEADTEIPEGLQLPFDAWPINLHIGKKDAQDSSPTEYEALIDEADYIAQQLIKQYNATVTGYNTVTISSISRPAFIKKHADCITGVVLTFILRVPDTTNLC
jgi:hypothetical protein